MKMFFRKFVIVKSCLIIIFSFFLAERAFAAGVVHPVPLPDSLKAVVLSPQPDSLAAVTGGTEKKNEKFIAAVLAFPVPFGVFGLHRIYLGTEPWVPVAYFVTLGGFGILPLIDFISIVTADSNQLESYKHNNKVFMWIN